MTGRRRCWRWGLVPPPSLLQLSTETLPSRAGGRMAARAVGCWGRGLGTPGLQSWARWWQWWNHTALWPGLQAAVGQHVATLQHPLGCVWDVALLLMLPLHSLNPRISTSLCTYRDEKTLCVCGGMEGGLPSGKAPRCTAAPSSFWDGHAKEPCGQHVGKDQMSWGEASVWPRGGVGTARGPQQWPPALLAPPPLHFLAGILPGWFYCRAQPNPAQGQQLALRANCCMATARTAISAWRAACPGPVPTRSRVPGSGTASLK